MPITAIAVLLYLLADSKLPPVVGPLSVQAGTVTYTRLGHKPTAVPLRYLARVGDVIHAGANTHATLLLRSSGQLYTLTAGSTVRIAKATVDRVAGPPLQVETLPMDVPDRTREQRMAMSSTVRGAEEPLSPKGAIRSGPIQLEWLPDSAASKLTLQLSKLDGSLIKEIPIPVDANKFAIPRDLVPDGEWVRVKLVVTYDSIRPGKRETLVRTLTDAERKRLVDGEVKLAAQKEGFGADYEWARAELLASYSLLDEMKAAWEAGLGPLKLKKNSAAAQWMLGQWYEAAGFPNDALAADERALQQGGPNAEIEDAIQRLSGD